jgi:hypothetical protein
MGHTSHLRKSVYSFFEQRESTLLQPDHNCGFDVNRKNGFQARFLIGLDRENINPDSVVSNLDEFPKVLSVG